MRIWMLRLSRFWKRTRRILFSWGDGFVLDVGDAGLLRLCLGGLVFETMGG